jgi:hypothetical protein
MSKEVMKLALSTLEGWANYDDWVWPESALEQAKRNTIEAITALRQALETEQEPVAFINVEKQKLEWAKLTSWHTPTIVTLPKIPLYTAPPKREWVGLTDEDMEDLLLNEDGVRFARYVEAKLKEKNT